MSKTQEVQASALPSDVQARQWADAVLARTKADEALVEVRAEQKSHAEFARNELLSLEGENNLKISLQVSIDGKRAKVFTQDATTQGLALLVDKAEEMARQRIELKPQGLLLPKPGKLQESKGLFSEATLQQGLPEAQGKQLRALVDLANADKVLAAGSLRNEATALLVLGSNGYGGCSRSSYCEYSQGTRTLSGKGAGWAWAGLEDASRLDARAVARRANDLAQRSENAVAVEPGRYTVILEPEALAQLLDLTVRWTTNYKNAETATHGGNVYSKKGGGTRLGERMADARVQWLYDPQDALMPFSPLHASGLMQRTFWLQDGVLQNLAYQPDFAQQQGRPVVVNPERVRMEVKGGGQTLEELIASTKRGIWIHHFGGLNLVDRPTLLLTGVTRDGTFLIENGKVSKPVKNMRFSESPFFMLNRLDAAGTPVRAHEKIVCPRIKVNDFEFTSLSDAI